MEDTVNFQHVLGYPECKNAKPIIETIEEPCPKCGGKIQIKKSKKGRKFYICENNPNGNCDYISWNKPKKDENGEEELSNNINKEKKTTEKKRKTKISK